MIYINVLKFAHSKSLVVNAHHRPLVTPKVHCQQMPDPQVNYQQVPDPQVNYRQVPDPQVNYRQVPDPQVNYLQTPNSQNLLERRRRRQRGKSATLDEGPTFLKSWLQILEVVKTNMILMVGYATEH